MQLIEREGESRIFYLSTFGSGMFDKYNGEPILWIEDFKGDIRFGDLLRYLDVYKCDLPARYKNGKALWSEVHITSVLHPLGAYRRMLAEKDRREDSEQQLLRRITLIRYHYRTGPLGSTEPKDYGYMDFPAETPIAVMWEFVKEKLKQQGVYIPSAYTTNGGQVDMEEVEDDGALPF